ncbi:hypothetical protein ABPG72_000091 [Tetrahymena utriculariae]
MEALEFQSSAKDSILKLKIYRLLVGFFVGISLSCSHQILNWLLSLISSNSEGNSIQNLVYCLLEAFFFISAAPLAIMSDNVLIISACLLVQLMFYIIVIAALQFFSSSLFLQYFITIFFALSRSILFGRLLVMMKNWYSNKKLVLCVGLTYFLNEFFSILTVYWDQGIAHQEINEVKDKIMFICLLLSSILGLIIQGKPSIMGLSIINEDDDSQQDQNEANQVQKKEKHQDQKGGIIQNVWGLNQSFVKKVYEDDNDAPKINFFKQLPQLKHLLFFFISSICLKLFDWYTRNQLLGSLQPFIDQQDFSKYIFYLGMFGLGGLGGIVALGIILDVRNQEFTLRMAICSAIGLSISYISSLLYNYGIIPQLAYGILVGAFEFSFYCTYQVGVPIVLVFDLLRYGDFSYLIIPIFSALDRIVNALYNIFNKEPQNWTNSSTVVQPLCISLMFLSLMIQYLKDRQRSSKIFQEHEEDDEDEFQGLNINNFLSEIQDDKKGDGEQSNLNRSSSKSLTKNNFKIQISSDDALSQDNQEHQFKNSLEQDTKFVIEKRNISLKDNISSDFD